MYFLSGSSSKSIDGQLLDAGRREREHLAEVRVPDERDVPELVPDRQALARLLGREDVLELLEAHRRAVAEVDVDVVELLAGTAGSCSHAMFSGESIAAWVSSAWRAAS